jgi:signal transduction histidine kinase
VIAALELDRRFARAGRVLGYLAFAVPVAVLAVAALMVTFLHLPAPSRWLLKLERRIANRWLDAQIPPLSTRRRWHTAARLAILAATAAAALVAAVIPAIVLVWVVELGVQGVGGLGDLEYLGPWSFGPALGLVLCVLALPAAVLVLGTLDALDWPLRRIVRATLAPRAASDGPVRELLAESLGDHSVSIVYWLPERSVFVDEVGHPVELPGRDSGRAWTAVERDGRRVAAIVHDAALDTSRELVEAAAAAAGLAIDNERLKADLRARLEELRVSRLRIVEAGDAARRRIERNLHDGAQQQLVALALQLRMLKSRLPDGELVPLVDELSDQLAAALAELRELARGIHPTILVDRGLGPAIDALAARASVPIVSRVAVTCRLPSAVEAAIYFLVAEALTNVAKYAHASSVRLDVRRDGEAVVVDVADDGVGGVDLMAGTGLRGLVDRLAALGGTLAIESPSGGGTHLRARIPCAVSDAEEITG